MTQVKHTHILVSHGPTTSYDVWARQMSLISRGTHEIRDALCRYDRDCLATRLEDGPLAELLSSDRPITIEFVPLGYRIEEV